MPQHASRHGQPGSFFEARGKSGRVGELEVSWLCVSAGNLVCVEPLEFRRAGIPDESVTPLLRRSAKCGRRRRRRGDCGSKILVPFSYLWKSFLCDHVFVGPQSKEHSGELALLGSCGHAACAAARVLDAPLGGGRPRTSGNPTSAWAEAAAQSSRAPGRTLRSGATKSAAFRGGAPDWPQPSQPLLGGTRRAGSNVTRR